MVQSYGRPNRTRLLGGHVSGPALVAGASVVIEGETVNKTATKQKKKKPSKTVVKETVRIVESLPADKAEALLDYAMYLAERADEAEWDRRFSDPKYDAKFSALLAEVEEEIAAGRTEPLDLDRL